MSITIENPHRTILHPQNGTYKGMTEDQPEYDAMSHPRRGKKYVTISSLGFQTYESYMHGDQSSKDDTSTPSARELPSTS